MNLHKYGIAEEDSDIRAHVSLPGRRVTVFRTADVLALISKNNYREATATQPGVDGATTSRGLLVPLSHVKRQFVLESQRFDWSRWKHEEMDCGQRGDMAVECVRAAILANRFPLWVCGYVNSDKEMDIAGTDIVVCAKRKIQVKYDYMAFPKGVKGTSGIIGSGNLYIQTHECNPLKMYGEAAGSAIR